MTAVTVRRRHRPGSSWEGLVAIVAPPRHARVRWPRAHRARLVLLGLVVLMARRCWARRVVRAVVVLVGMAVIAAGVWVGWLLLGARLLVAITTTVVVIADLLRGEP